MPSGPMSREDSTLSQQSRRVGGDVTTEGMVSDALAECAASMIEQLASGAGAKDIRESVAVFVATARLQQTPPERVLAMLKEALRSATGVAAMPPDNRVDLTRELIAMAIEAYYEEQRCRRDGT